MGGPRVRGTARDDGRSLYTDRSGRAQPRGRGHLLDAAKRYGIVFRDVLARETNLPKWRELQMAFRRLEDRGEIRGGRFVDGFLGEQFALPVAVESLRATRKMPLPARTITLSAADPLNLVGILVPGERVPAISGRTVSFRDGVPADQTNSAQATVGGCGLRESRTSKALEPLSLDEDQTCNCDREQLPGTHVPSLSRYAWSASSTKTVSICRLTKKNREPEEGVSGLPTGPFPRQDCQKRFPHRFARSGLMLI